VTDSIFHFFNSNFFQTLITLLVGFVALYIYNRQKNDQKRAAANSIYLEIQHIERSIPKVKEAARRGSLNNLDVSLLREDGWSKYNHLFSSDFDKDEWEVITDFYANARTLDEAIKLSNTSFNDDIAQIRVNKQRVLADITKGTVNQPIGDGEQVVEQYNKKLEVFDKLYMSRQDDFAYTPVKYLNDAKKCLEELSNISITTIGTKFKKIIGIK
jgi:predicted DNA-binding protein YlxM (UPF0122 family)